MKNWIKKDLAGFYSNKVNSFIQFAFFVIIGFAPKQKLLKGNPFYHFRGKLIYNLPFSQ